MKKMLAALVVAVTMLGLSGCFPVFVPVHDHGHGHYYRGWGNR